jgi:hypothetical protein
MTSVREVQRAVPGVQTSRIAALATKLGAIGASINKMTHVYYPSCETIYTAAGVKQARDGIPDTGRVPMGDASFELVKARKHWPRHLRSWGCRLMGRRRRMLAACIQLCSASINTSQQNHNARAPACAFRRVVRPFGFYGTAVLRHELPAGPASYTYDLPTSLAALRGYRYCREGGGSKAPIDTIGNRVSSETVSRYGL